MFTLLTGHLTGYDKKSQIVRYFPGRLCDKMGLLCDNLRDYFRANLHCLTRFQRRKTTLMLFNGQFECKGIIKHLFSNKIVKFVRFFWTAKEKGHLLNITWCSYTADHNAYLWNHAGSKVQVTFHKSRVQVIAPSINYQTTQIPLDLIEHFVKRVELGDSFNAVHLSLSW